VEALTRQTALEFAGRIRCKCVPSFLVTVTSPSACSQPCLSLQLHSACYHRHRIPPERWNVDRRRRRVSFTPHQVSRCPRSPPAPPPPFFFPPQILRCKLRHSSRGTMRGCTRRRRAGVVPCRPQQIRFLYRKRVSLRRRQAAAHSACAPVAEKLTTLHLSQFAPCASVVTTKKIIVALLKPRPRHSIPSCP
jgi:hypothetical protein